MCCVLGYFLLYAISLQTKHADPTEPVRLLTHIVCVQLITRVEDTAIQRTLSTHLLAGRTWVAREAINSWATWIPRKSQISGQAINAYFEETK